MSLNSQSKAVDAVQSGGKELLFRVGPEKLVPLGTLAAAAGRCASMAEPSGSLIRGAALYREFAAAAGSFTPLAEPLGLGAEAYQA